MKEEGQNLNNQVETGDDLLDFDLDDLDDISSKEIERAFSEMDDDIIELSDLVEEGTEDEETMDMEVSNWLKESQSVDVHKHMDLEGLESAGLDQAPAEKGLAIEEEDLDLSDISLEFHLEGEEGAEPEETVGEGFITEAELDFLTEETLPGEETLDLAKEEKPEVGKEAADEIGEGDFDFLMEEGTLGEETLDFATEERRPVEEEAAAGMDEVDLDFLVEEGTLGEETLDLAREEKLEVEEEAAGGIVEADLDLTLEEEPIEEEERGTQKFEAKGEMPEETAGEEALELPDDFSFELESDLEEEMEELIAEGMISQLPAGESTPEEAAGEFDEKPLIEEEAAEALPPSADLIGLTAEKIEATIARVVEEVVERVARETMTKVAERVITEAIEALRKSLESRSE
ncbi:MAG: hypothetical protein V1758_00915 [Pseudomonadota bacterium]